MGLCTQPGERGRENSQREDPGQVFTALKLGEFTCTSSAGFPATMRKLLGTPERERWAAQSHLENSVYGAQTE